MEEIKRVYYLVTIEELLPSYAFQFKHKLTEVSYYLTTEYTEAFSKFIEIKNKEGYTVHIREIEVTDEQARQLFPM